MLVRLLPRTAVLAATALTLMSIGRVAAASPDPTLGPGAWFEGLTSGVCFDTRLDPTGSLDFSVPPPIVPCAGSHDNEIAGVVSLGEGDYPRGDLGDIMAALCGPVYGGFLGRPIEMTGLTPAEVWPAPDAWAAGVHDALCAVGLGEPLTGTAASARLRAPGETLAVYHQPGDSAQLWLADAGTGSLLREVSDDAHSMVLGAPDWAPDGTALAATVEVGEGDVDAWLFPIDGSAPSPLAMGPGKQDGASLSPDGRTLAYISDDGLPEYDIFRRALGGGPVTRLTEHDGRDASAQWSPDGTRLLFRRVTGGLSDIWVMAADGTDQLRLTDNGADNFDPRWSPDGRHVLYTTTMGGDADIWLMAADGSGQRPLTDHPADDEYPTWSADGSMIAFQSSRYGGPTVWLMRADGSEVSLLVADQPVGYPMFAPVPVE